jgi:hypothetical protein
LVKLGRHDEGKHSVRNIGQGGKIISAGEQHLMLRSKVDIPCGPCRYCPDCCQG